RPTTPNSPPLVPHCAARDGSIGEIPHRDHVAEPARTSPHPRRGAARPGLVEVRCWREGVLPDADEAVGGPQVVSSAPTVARLILDSVSRVPALTWGLEPGHVGDMWNSNSVVSWLLAEAGVTGVAAPIGGRAPGWETGLAVSRLGRATQ